MRMRKPLITLVNGPAAGAGMSLAIMGDFVFASRAAHFTAAFTALGLSPDGGMSWLLPRMIGMRKAQDLLLSNRRISSEEAEAIGLITRAVDNEQLEGAGAEWRLGSSPNR
jgi:2-(1,2-epoxy-1,2-dihydrophenyl)acetyl-CoA isomerase